MHTVLLIDGDDRLASLLAEYFSRYELHRISETHPHQGLEKIQNNSDISLVILDVMLPDMDWL